ncbi:hypothetical protein [Microcoleus sp. AT9b-C3]|uniref:hypothetical protein n=1 Tax=Microcoleus sp. AT9b-C3 TaxID=2818629 RepID=UPI002FCFA064
MELQCSHLRVAVGHGWGGNRCAASFPVNKCLETNILEIREEDTIALTALLSVENRDGFFYK